MLNYITSNSNENFVQWQKKNEKTSDGKLEVNIGLFVLYTTNQV